MNATQTSIKVLISHFKKQFPLNKEEQAALTDHFTEKKVKRKGFILQAGDVCRHFTFVVSGCFKLYAVDKNEKEHNLQFAVEDEWVTDLSSFYAEKPSMVYIEAIEPSVILQVKHGDLLHLYTSYHKFDRNFRIIIERKYIDLQQRILQNISLTADERYQDFMDQHPELANRLPNTQIASYLGVTPEFLSKVRKKLVKK